MAVSPSLPPHKPRRYELEMKRQRAIKKAIHLTRQTVAKEVGFGRLLAARAHVACSRVMNLGTGRCWTRRSRAHLWVTLVVLEKPGYSYV
jgi:hypothetical protein